MREKHGGVWIGGIWWRHCISTLAACWWMVFLLAMNANWYAIISVMKKYAPRHKRPKMNLTDSSPGCAIRSTYLPVDSSRYMIEYNDHTSRVTQQIHMASTKFRRTIVARSAAFWRTRAGRGLGQLVCVCVKNVLANSMAKTSARSANVITCTDKTAAPATPLYVRKPMVVMKIRKEEPNTRPPHGALQRFFRFFDF
jgi:hypothetical protein